VPAHHINTVWARISANAGSEFRMIEGATFRYQNPVTKIAGRSVVLVRTNRTIPKSHFEKALALVPLEKTTEIKDLRGPFYLYAILMDDRIRQIDW
jgi:hypothetical protein